MLWKILRVVDLYAQKDLSRGGFAEYPDFRQKSPGDMMGIYKPQAEQKSNVFRGPDAARQFSEMMKRAKNKHSQN